MESTSSILNGSLGTNQGVRGRKGVQQADVSRAADAILAAGMRPTVERVRSHLGTGSPNTVAPMLESWFKGLSVRVTGMAPGLARDGLPPAAQNAFRLMWDTAMGEANALAAAAVEEQRGALGAQASRLAEDQRVLEASRIATKEAIRSARKEAEQQQTRADELGTTLRRTEGQLEAATRLAAELRGELGAERNLRQGLEESNRADLARERERAVAAERRLLGEVDLAREDVRRAERAALAAAETNTALNARLEVSGTRMLELTRELAERQELLLRSQAETTQAKAAEQAANSLLAAADGRAHELVAALGAERLTTAELRRSIVRLEGAAKGRSAMRQTRSKREKLGAAK